MMLSPLPQHITVLYLITVFSSIFVAWVSADVMIYSIKTHHQVDREYRDMSSRFGGQVPPEGVRAFVIYADPPDACKPIRPPPNSSEVPNFTGRWAVLIRRYGCNFEVKVRHAQNASFDIAIVHNVNSSELEPMSANDPHGITIPSVFVGDYTGHVLKDNYVYNNSYYILIDDESPFDLNTHLLLPFAIVVGISFVTMLGFMVSVIVKCIKDQRRARRHRLPASSLHKIPTAKFRKGDPYETCAICLDDFIEGEKLRILPCSHAYHSKCIDPWLTRNRRVCPICKRKVFAADEVAENHGDSDSDSEADDTTPLVRSSSVFTRGGTFTSTRTATSDPFDRHQNPFDNESVDQHQNPFDNDSTSSSSSGDTEPPGPSCSQSEGVNTENNTSTYSFSSMDLLVYQRIQQILRDPTILLRTNNSNSEIVTETVPPSSNQNPNTTEDV